LLSSLDLKVKEIVQKCVSYPLEVFDLKIQSGSNHSLIEIVLDNLKHPTGSVTISECEKISRCVSSELEQFGEDFNFTLQVGSAGAERAIRLPSELNRFQGQAARLFYYAEDDKLKDGVFIIEGIENEFVILKKVKRDKNKKKEDGLLKIEISKIKKGNLALNI